MQSVTRFIGFSIAAALILPRLGDRMYALAPHAMSAVQPVAAQTTPLHGSTTRSVVIRSGPSGHFEVDGRVDGRSVRFLVDTGASVVALTQSDAASLGLHPADREFTALVKTANGTVQAAPAELSRVEIDDLALHDVQAVVLPDSALSDNLLGLSFLSRLRRFEYSDGQLMLEQ